MRDIRKKVFISSVIREMKDFREAAKRAIHEAGMEPVTLDFQEETSNLSPLELNKQALQECDVFVGLYGFEPAWMPPESEKNIIELEYEWAMNNKLPMFLYIPHEKEYSGHIPTQPDWHMVSFRKLLHERHVVGLLSTPEKLISDLLQRLMNLQSKTEEVQKVEPSVSEPPKKILLTKIGATSIFTANTDMPWQIPADAFTIPITPDFNLQEGLISSLLKPLNLDMRRLLIKVIEMARESQAEFKANKPLLFRTPKELRNYILCSNIVITTPFNPKTESNDIKLATLSLLEAVVSSKIKRLTLTFFEVPGEALSITQTAEEMLKSISEFDKIEELSEITIAADFSKLIDIKTIADISKNIFHNLYKKVVKKERRSTRLSSKKFKEHRALGEISRGNRVLQKGHRGKAVTAVQEVLIQAGLLEADSLDGVFGPETEKAVKTFQSQHDITVNGIIGPETLAQLDAQAAQLESRQGDVGSTDEFQESHTPEYFEPERALYSNDQTTIKDSLNMEIQAERFARLFVAEDVFPPLSLGLFGNWGVGKTYFMQLIQQKITALTTGKTGDGKSPYVGRVAQITFNAWHYIDADLWANLAVRIFDGLAEELQKNLGPAKDENNYETIRRRLRSEIHSSQETKRMAEQRQEQAQGDRQDAAKKLQTLKADCATKKSQFGKLRLTRLINSDKAYRQYRDKLETVAKEFGLANSLDTVDDIVRLARQFQQLDGRFKTLLSAIGGRFQGNRVIWTTIALVVFFFFIIFLKPLTEMFVAILPDFFKTALSDISGTVVQIVALASSAVTWIGRQYSTVSGALDKLETLKSGLEKLKTDPQAENLEAALQRDIEKFDAEIRKEEEKINEADRRIAEAEAEIQRINAGGLVYDFTKDRTKDPHYLEHLGIISIIRKDFEDLGELLQDWRTHAGDSIQKKEPESPPKPIERIILYIDDLDRCHPDRVVEVLQAVHLLLALPLFNIVVAVDARWLERSLYKAYLPESVADKLALGEQVSNIEFSPQQYLEKIFQIPFSLPYMSESGYYKLVDDLVLTRKEYEKKLLEDDYSQKAVQSFAETVEMIETSEQVSLEDPSQVVGLAGKTHDIEHDQPQEIEEPMLSNLQAVEEISQNLNPSSEGQVEAKEEQAADLNKETLEVRVSEEAMRKSLLLEDNEQAYLQAVHGFIDTPRLTKRLINIYRLIRVTAVEKGFDKFIDDARGGEYRAAIILLAINIGFPQVSAKLFRILIDRQEDKSWTLFLNVIYQVVAKAPKVTSPVPKWAQNLDWSEDEKRLIAKIISHMKNLEKKFGMPDNLDVYRTWAPEVGRYSFQWHLPIEVITDQNVKGLQSD